MENQQPRQPDRPDQTNQSHVVPPRVRIPQVPPQYVTTQRRVSVVSSVTKISLPDQLPRTPMPGQPTRQRRAYTARSGTFISLPQRTLHTSQTPRPQFFAGKVPTYAPSTRQQPPIAPIAPIAPMDSMLPQTPLPSANAFTSGVYNISLPVSPKSFPDRPPISIPGSHSTQQSRTEYGVGETLMGCGVLIAIGIIALVVLYYISV